jgi:hypothetical protein
MADFGLGRRGVPGWLRTSLVVLSVTLLVALDPLPPGRTSTKVHRVVRNCAADSRGALTLLLPEQGSSYSRDSVRVEARGNCRGGLPFGVGVDDIGYGLSHQGRLIPRPQHNPGCQSCWPQLGVGGSTGPFSHRLSVPPGTHTLTLKPGIQGTDLPRFRAIRIVFEVSPASLPGTGFSVRLLVGLMFILALCGLIAEAAARRASRRATR